MIIPQTTRLIKAAAKLTGLREKTILLRTRDKAVNAVRTAIWEILLDLGHSRHRIAEAFGCDARSVKWAVEHPTGESRTLAHKLRLDSPEYYDCGSGHAYGICPQCGKGHGWILYRKERLPSADGQPKPATVAIGLRYSR